MRHLRRLPGLLALLGCCSLGAASSPTRDLDRLFSAGALSDVGVLVEALGGPTLYQRNAGASLMPASNMKLVTCATALRTWGESYPFRTTVCADASPDARGTVAGNLYLRGAAPPPLDSRLLTAIAAQLARDGLKRVCGAILSAGPVDSATAPPGGLGEAKVLAEALSRAGVALGGPAGVVAAPPAAAIVLRRWDGPDAEALLLAMNKPSSNAIADGLMRGLLCAHGAADGSYDELVAAAWRQLGLPLEGCRFVDGSGLSRQNRLTPRFLVGLLQYMRGESEYAGAFVHTLPVAGLDGTLRTRMRGTCAEGCVRAKTGFLTGACCLSGYVDRGGRRLCFSMMMNNHRAGGDAVRDLQNRACVVLAKWCETR